MCCQHVLDHLGSDADDELRNTTIPPSWQGWFVAGWPSSRISRHQYRRTCVSGQHRCLMADESPKFEYHQHTHVNSTDEISPVVEHQRCIAGKGLVTRRNSVALWWFGTGCWWSGTSNSISDALPWIGQVRADPGKRLTADAIGLMIHGDGRIRMQCRWSTVSNAADRSSGANAATSPRSSAIRISDSTLAIAVSAITIRDTSWL